MSVNGVRPTIRELIEQCRPGRGDDQPPTSKAGLARFMAGLFEHQGDALPNFDEFIYALARPRWKWTPKADRIFRCINRIRSPTRSPIRGPGPTVRDIILHLDEARGRNKRPAVRRQNNRRQPAPAPVHDPVPLYAPAPAPVRAPVHAPAPAGSESSLSECTVESIEISSTAPTACTPSNGHL